MSEIAGTGWGRLWGLALLAFAFHGAFANSGEDVYTLSKSGNDPALSESSVKLYFQNTPVDASKKYYVPYNETFSTWNHYGFYADFIGASYTGAPHDYDKAFRNGDLYDVFEDYHWTKNGIQNMAVSGVVKATINAVWQDGTIVYHSLGGYPDYGDDGTLRTINLSAVVYSHSEEVTPIEFIGGHDLYTDNSWLDSTTPLTGAAYACKTQGTKLKLKVALDVEPAGVPYSLVATCAGKDYLSFTKTGLSSVTGTDEVTLDANANLPSVGKFSGTLSWKLVFTEPDPDLEISLDTTSHVAYSTFGSPDGNATRERIDWACTKAQGATTARGVADGIHAGLAGSPPIDGAGGTVTDNWILLGGGSYSGNCDHQARLMVRALKILGSTGTDYLTFASQNTSLEDYQDETFTQGGFTWYLKFDFDNDGVVDNNFEGCVESAGHFYAVWPSLDADSKCLLLRKIGPDQVGSTQRYVRTVAPGLFYGATEQHHGSGPSAYPTCN